MMTNEEYFKVFDEIYNRRLEFIESCCKEISILTFIFDFLDDNKSGFV